MWALLQIYKKEENECGDEEGDDEKDEEGEDAGARRK